jgi:hypothetical protein
MTDLEGYKSILISGGQLLLDGKDLEKEANMSHYSVHCFPTIMRALFRRKAYDSYGCSTIFHENNQQFKTTYYTNGAMELLVRDEFEKEFKEAIVLCALMRFSGFVKNNFHYSHTCGDLNLAMDYSNHLTNEGVPHAIQSVSPDWAIFVSNRIWSPEQIEEKMEKILK